MIIYLLNECTAKPRSSRSSHCPWPDCGYACIWLQCFLAGKYTIYWHHTLIILLTIELHIVTPTKLSSQGVCGKQATFADHSERIFWLQK